MIVCSLCNIRRSAAGWSSLAARRAHNPKVVGSTPAPATKSEKAAFLWPFLCLEKTII